MTKAREIKQIPALEELKARNQWVTYTLSAAKASGRRGKVPHQPLTGWKASPTNPAHWSSYMDAVWSLRRRGHDGLSLVLTAADPYAVIDLDDCVDEQGQISDWATAVLGRFDSYTEYTPSGMGLHIWLRGKLPPGGRRKDHVELYDEAKAITVTGRQLTGTPETIEDRSGELVAFHREVFPPAPPYMSAPVVSSTLQLSDDEVIGVATRARNGVTFESLMRGELRRNHSKSEGDMALVGYLANYTQNTSQLERIWRRSALWRAKCERNRGYVKRTIQRAIESRAFTYRTRTR